jgi:hypothetical protein
VEQPPPQHLTCLVTIHGMGFQTPPSAGQPGYADRLEEELQALLPELGGDPVSEFGRTAGTGAVYVHSEFPVNSGKIEEGLKRLGTWGKDGPNGGKIDTRDVPLVDADRGIAHVALVYAGLEEDAPHPGASIEALAKAIIGLHNYTSIPSLVGMGLTDVATALLHRRHHDAPLTPSLQPRVVRDVQGEKRVVASGNGGPWDVIRELEGDIVTYICRNDLRERVRDFVREALLRLCSREDVDRVVVNSHSLGTVVAFDALRVLPAPSAAAVKRLVTAGSPLRKFADIFYWGTDAGCIYQFPWTNFWDGEDPVADPLAPDQKWRRGNEVPPTDGLSHLYTATDANSGANLNIRMDDVKVTNEAHGAGGGLPSHNYWDSSEFVQKLADLLAASRGT